MQPLSLEASLVSCQPMPAILSISFSVANIVRVLGRDKKFMAAAIGFIEQTLLAAEAIRVLPKAIAP